MRPGRSLLIGRGRRALGLGYAPSCDAVLMTPRAWRRTRRLAGAAFAIALAIKGVQLARGADTDHGLWAVGYVAVFGFWLLVDRLAERKSQEPQRDEV